MTQIYSISFLLIALLILAYFLLKERAFRKQRGLFFKWPIPKKDLQDWAPLFTVTKLGPSRKTCVKMFGNIGVTGGTSDREAWILSVLSKQSKKIFEFGTCTGKTTYLLALNSPKEAEVHTLTLHPDQIDTYLSTAKDAAKDKTNAMHESAFNSFVYTGTPEEKKVTQIFCDSKTFDEKKLHNQFDLIFIDGSHAYSYVKSDSEKALKMIKPGGFILWHDYKGPNKAPGVFKALNELNETCDLFHIKGTNLVVYLS